MLRRIAHKQQLAVFSLSLYEINRALKPEGEKKQLNLADHMPKEYHEFLPLFSEAVAKVLPPHRPYDHKFPLHEGFTPPFGPLYSLSKTELQALKEWLEENLSKGFIHASSSPAASPILLAKKGDGSLRLCVDYRGLNEGTINNRYPLPLLQEMLMQLSKAKYFTTLDIRGAYNLVRMAEGEEWKTAFQTQYGLFELLVMPFGLTNAPADFQALINDVLHQFLDDFCTAFLDDLKTAFTTAPILRHFDYDRELVVETDALDYVLAGVLSQYDNEGTLHPVAFYSKKHSQAECNYEIYDKELLAIVRAFEEWRPHLQGSSHPIQVLSDHKNLEYFMSTKCYT